VEHWQGKDISVSSSPKQRVQCDGELIETIPLHIKVIPGAIKVLVPKRTRDEKDQGRTVKK
jgi:diacylglycerol kinase family enzyme